jgi:hypothetical protein
MHARPYLTEARGKVRLFKQEVERDRERLARVLHTREVERLILEFDRRGSEIGRQRCVKQLRRHLDPIVSFVARHDRPPRAAWAPVDVDSGRRCRGIGSRSLKRN